MDGPAPGSQEAHDTITVTAERDRYVARDETTGVASQGETKADALANLADALELRAREIPDGADADLSPSDAPWFESG